MFRNSFAVLLSVVLLVSCAGVGSSTGFAPREIAVKAGPHDRQNCPVRFTMPVDGAKHVRLVDKESGEVLPAQVGEKNAITFILPSLAAGAEKRYTVEASSAGTGGIDAKNDGEGRIDILQGGKLFTAYHYAEKYKKPFLYPVLGANGARLTRGWPMEEFPGEPQDHVHQKSLWVAHGEVNSVDYWGEGGGSGTQRTDELVAVESGDAFVRIHAKNSWVNRADETILAEEREYVFYNTPAAARSIDLTVTVTATEGDVTFGDTKEGGMCSLRVNPVINGNAAGEIRNSLGQVGERECWGRRAAWCDYSGPIDGRVNGIAILDHPKNLRHPTCWHVRDYGLMAANCFGYSYFKSTHEKSGDFVLPAGESVTFRYRVFVHAGGTIEAKVGDRYIDYITPPTVRVLK